MYYLIVLILALAFKISNCTPFAIHNGATIDMTWDVSASQLVITAKVPANTWLGFGWGSSMNEVLLLEWSANGANSY